MRGIQAIFSHRNVLKNAVLKHVRLVTPAMRPLMFVRHESVSAAHIEEHGFESTKIADILKAKGKNADGSWLWCTTEDTVYDAVKSVGHQTRAFLDAFLVLDCVEPNDALHLSP